MPLRFITSDYKAKNRISVVLDERTDADLEVENAKSAWQALRGERDWTKGRDRVDNARVKKLYEILEKMTCEIDRVQRNYMDPKANCYLHKSANNVLRTDKRPNLQEEAEIVRGVIYPDRKAKLVSHLRYVDSEIVGTDAARARFDGAAGNILADKRHKSSKCAAKRRSVGTNANKQDIVAGARSVHAIAPCVSTCNKKGDAVNRTFADGKMRARIKSSVEEYLQCYGDNVHKSRGIEEKERSRDASLAASCIADILTSHNIGSRLLYETFEKRSGSCDSDDYTSENDENRSSSNTALDATRVTSVDSIQEIGKIRSNTSFGSTGLCNDTRSTALDARRSSSVTNCQDDVFIKMKLNKKLSRDVLSQVLQSEYLKKDLSL